MESFKEIRFPEDISYGSSGGPGYSTDIITTSNGYEQRNINWSNARCIYNIAHGIKNQKQLDELISFFRIVHGKAFGFRYKDWLDYRASEQIISLGNGTDKKFQLVKSYYIEGLHKIRTIKKPVKNTVKIYLNGELYKNIYVDYINGSIEFDRAVDREITITGDFEFDTPVRFDTDNISAVIDNYDIYSLYNIALVEIKI